MGNTYYLNNLPWLVTSNMAYRGEPLKPIL